MNPEGTFRFSKAPGILELPRASVTAPGATMPLTQSPLESADGRSYYLLYPLRPGVTTFEIDQILPYKDRTYVYRRKFYQDLKPFDVGVVPADATLTGEGLREAAGQREREFCRLPERADQSRNRGGLDLRGWHAGCTAGDGRDLRAGSKGDAHAQRGRPERACSWAARPDRFHCGALVRHESNAGRCLEEPRSAVQDAEGAAGSAPESRRRSGPQARTPGDGSERAHAAARALQTTA